MCAQISEAVLLPIAELMFPEGQSTRPTAVKKEGGALPLIIALLINAKAAVASLFKARGYHPKKPEVTKAKLGYALDQYEATAYLVTSRLKKPLLSQPEAKLIGKRIENIIGDSGTIGAKLKALRKRGKGRSPQYAALLQSAAALNLSPPPRASANAQPLSQPAPTPAPAPAPAPPPPPVVVPPPSVPLQLATESTPPVDYLDIHLACVRTANGVSHPYIPGYRGAPADGEAELRWNPEKPPCVPSDHRPAHLFASREAAEAAGAADMVERLAPRPDDGEGDFDEERYELACVKHKHAMRRLCESFTEIRSDERGHTRPCACGRGALAVWPWVVQTAQLGFCECRMASWERTCWRSEWIRAGYPDLAW